MVHKLYELGSIKEISNVKFMHLDVIYDETLKKIIYGRKLKDGIGESIYGIEIAKHILDDSEFIKNAISIRNLLLKQNNTTANEDTARHNVLNRGWLPHKIANYTQQSHDCQLIALCQNRS